MPFEPKPNSGVLFTARDRKSDNSPQMTGNITFGGDLIEYLNDCLSKRKEPKLDLSAWKKEGKNGAYLSLSIKPAWEGGGSRRADTPARRISSSSSYVKERDFDDPLDSMPWDK